MTLTLTNRIIPSFLRMCAVMRNGATPTFFEKVLIELIGPYSCRTMNTRFGEDSIKIVTKVDFGRNSFLPRRGWTKTAGPHFGKREENY